MNNKGFTLIELLIVAAMLGIIAAVIAGKLGDSRYDPVFDIAAVEDYCLRHDLKPVRTSCHKDEGIVKCVVATKDEKLYLQVDNNNVFEIIPD